MPVTHFLLTFVLVFSQAFFFFFAITISRPNMSYFFVMCYGLSLDPFKKTYVVFTLIIS